MIFWRGFLPLQPPVPMKEVGRIGVGAFLGLGITGLLSTWWFGNWSTPMVIAPMGAASVLMFSLPDSPRIQPFAMAFGCLLAALIGITCAIVIPNPLLAVSAAIGLTLMVQALCRCTHPPGGAVAVVTVLGGQQVLHSGYHFVFIPVMLNTMLLLIIGFIYNNLTGKPYPSRQLQLSVPIGPLQRADYQAVLTDYEHLSNISVEDLEAMHVALEKRR